MTPRPVTAWNNFRLGANPPMGGIALWPSGVLFEAGTDGDLDAIVEVLKLELGRPMVAVGSLEVAADPMPRSEARE